VFAGYLFAAVLMIGAAFVAHGGMASRPSASRWSRWRARSHALE
jgi:hypothetical protein